MAEQLHPEDIYQTLEHDIVTLKIKPGETISENQLCKRFGISRTPVRAALQRLEQNGFVQIIPCKGTIVTPINLDIVDQIAYQRTAVESMVLLDFIEQVEYHTAGEFPVEVLCFANGQLYEIVPIPRGKETMLCQLLRLPQKDAGKRLVVVDDAEQIDALDIPHTAGFCTVAADGTVSYYRKEAGI